MSTNSQTQSREHIQNADDTKNQRGRKSRKKLLQEARREIREVYEEFRERMSEIEGGLIGAIYARYSSRYQDSIAAQVRSILEYALKHGIYIPLEHIFFDVAVRGSKLNRDGLGKVEEALKSKQASVLLVLKTNRLFRKTYRCLQWIDLAVKRWKSRLIFVKDNLDSQEKGFDGIRLQMSAMLDEYGGRAHVDNVVSQHIHLASQRIITGTITFGFRGEEVLGQETRRGGIRQKWAIDDFCAMYVRKIFTWFVKDELSRAEIVRRLEADPKAPLPPKSAGSWSLLAINHLLSNERYLGIFKYGERMNVDMPDADYLIRELRDEPLFVGRYEDLRIVEPETWFEAQRMIDKKKANGGRRRKATSEPTGSELIRGLFVCPEHEQPMWISGDHIYCPKCQKQDREKRFLASKLPVKLAVKMLLDAIIQQVVHDREFVELTHTTYVESLGNRDAIDPVELNRQRALVNDLGRRINSLKQDKGSTDLEIQETEETLRELRMEREELRTRVARLEFEAEREITIPNLDQTVERLTKLADGFLDSDKSKNAQVLGRLRRAIQLLVGDQIPLTQMGSRECRKGWLRAEFDACVGSWLDQDVSPSASENFPSRRIVIDFQRPCPFQDEADEAYKLDTVELIPRKEIGAKLGCSKAKVTKLLKYAYEQRGVPYVDGRSRRAAIAPPNPPAYDQHHERVMELYGQDWLLQAIADDVGVCKDTITKVVRIWHEQNSVKLEDGRTRRKRLAVKNRPRR